MANTGGFDVIGEIHIETITDFINLKQITNPVDGKSIYLLGGPFSTDLTMDLGPLGMTTVRVILEATLKPMVHQSLAQFVISLTGGSTAVAGRSLSHIGGQVTVSVPLAFTTLPTNTPAPAGEPPACQVPVLLLAGVAPEVVLDNATRGLADATLGQGGADLLTLGLRGAVAVLLAAAGTLPFPAFGFCVVPGIDSNDPKQLSAPPIVAWIDRETLGVFGYYRAVATGGDVNAKQKGDLDQTSEEFFYDPSALISLVPGRRAALLLSAGAFQQVLACPGIKNVVRGLVERRDQNDWRTLVRNSDGAAILNDETQANLYKYVIDEYIKDPVKSSDSIAADVERAKARVQADVDAIIERRAHAEEDAWLDHTPEGQQAITDAVPPPCGNGSVQIIRTHVAAPGAQSDFIAMLRHLEVQLGAERISVHYSADGFLEDLFGDVSISVSGDMDIFINVSEQGAVSSNFDLHPPAVDVGATGLTGDLLAIIKAIFQVDGAWGVIMAYLSLVLQAKATAAIADQFPFSIPVSLPQSPFPTRIANIAIDPTSCLLLGLIGRHPRWNEFNPGVDVDATIDQRVPADEAPVHGTLTRDATEWGCPAVKFDTLRTFWDTTVSVRGRLRDAPLPLTVVGWQVQLDNFSVGNAHMIDPRPTSPGVPAAISPGNLVLAGTVNHPDPPLVAIEGPAALGHLQLREDVMVEVTGDANSGWRLRFRGVDGNFYVRFSLTIRDGEGVEWSGETLAIVQGDQLELPAEYTQYKADCDAKYARFWQLQLAARGRLVAVGKVQPGQPVMSGEIREAIAVRTLVNSGSPAAFRELVNAATQFGPEILGQVGRVPTVTVVRS